MLRHSRSQSLTQLHSAIAPDLFRGVTNLLTAACGEYIGSRAVGFNVVANVRVRGRDKVRIRVRGKEVTVRIWVWLVGLEQGF